MRLRDRLPRGTLASPSERFLDLGRQISLHMYPITPALGMEIWTGYSNRSIDISSNNNNNNSTLGAEFKMLTVSLHSPDTYLAFKDFSLKVLFAEQPSD